MSYEKLSGLLASSVVYGYSTFGPNDYHYTMTAPLLTRRLQGPLSHTGSGGPMVGVVL